MRLATSDLFTCAAGVQDVYQLPGHALRGINKRRAGATADRVRWRRADVAAAVGAGRSPITDGLGSSRVDLKRN